MESRSVFLHIAKFADFRFKNSKVNRTQGMGHMTHAFFWDTLGMV